MASQGDLIDFEVIDAHKENIQALPSGRSAKALAQIYSPPLLAAQPSPNTINEAHLKARAAFERELLAIEDVDDPLDIYDRYVRWTLDTFPSAQATPQSQLLPLLERATKAFQRSPQHKNDSRYLKLWLHYIRLFSDAPREAFVFLARNGIGETLALYYEEFAAWLENSGRWNQAEEVFAMGIDKGAQPIERLSRKHNDFAQRKQLHTEDPQEPSSPALPVARPALAAKADPFASSSSSQNPQTESSTFRKAKPSKMQVFADSDEQARPSSTDSSKGWDNIGTIADRKKENTIAARPMVGEKLKVGKTNGGMQKMMIFRDTLAQASASDHSRPMRLNGTYERQCTVNPKNGRLECVFVNLEAVYLHDSRAELCFEELRAQRRQWRAKRKQEHLAELSTQTAREGQSGTSRTSPSIGSGTTKFKIFEDPIEAPTTQSQLAKTLAVSLTLTDEDLENRPPGQSHQAVEKKARREEKANRTRKINVMDVNHISNTTKTIQLNMDSPPSKLKRKKAGSGREQTMTINTKEAMEEIYGIFSQPLPSTSDHKLDSGDESDSSDDCTTDGESTGTATGKLSAPTSEYGDETKRELYGTHPEEPIADVDNLTGWSDYSADARHRSSDDQTSTAFSQSQNELTSDVTHSKQHDLYRDLETDDMIESDDQYLPGEEPESLIPAPAAYNPLPNHRLPFMTPIAELTESSLGTLTVNKQRELLSTKTPSRQIGSTNMTINQDELLSSPFQEITPDFQAVKQRVLQPVRTKSTKGTLSLGHGSAQSQIQAQTATGVQELTDTEHIIQDPQCNPMDPNLRAIILAQMRPTVSALRGYHEDIATNGNKASDIRKWAKAVAKASRTSTAADKPVPVNTAGPTISFDETNSTYHFKRELGAGTFAPVFLVERTSPESGDEAADSQQVDKNRRQPFEAIKMEDPPSAWEFFMINQIHDRLSQSRTADSIIRVHEMHVYRDECFMVEQYRDQGTLLDLVNLCRSDSSNAAGMDEMLAMWCSIELLRTLEALHSQHLVHGDLKGDNILVRFDDPGTETDWSSVYFPSGSHGWSSKGLCLIDFGRAIDMQHFQPNVGFIADWKTTEADCAEMREMRPWTYQIDYHGLAGTLHSMLFGKYMEVIGEKGAGLGQGVGKTYRIRDNFKRYWQTDIWAEVFDLLLNPLTHVQAEKNQKMPLLNGMRACRERMEAWLEDNCEKGVGLKGMISKLECVIKEKKRRRRS